MAFTSRTAVRAVTGICALLAFAWLARQAIEGIPAGRPEVTGARGARVLGAIYPA